MSAKQHSDLPDAHVMSLRISLRFHCLRCNSAINTTYTWLADGVTTPETSAARVTCWNCGARFQINAATPCVEMLLP